MMGVTCNSYRVTCPKMGLVEDESIKSELWLLTVKAAVRNED